MQPDNQSDDRTIYRKELMAALNVTSSETIRRWLKSERLPPPDVNLSQRTQGCCGAGCQANSGKRKDESRHDELPIRNDCGQKYRSLNQQSPQTVVTFFTST